jgi:MoxR-like ATPase
MPFLYAPAMPFDLFRKISQAPTNPHPVPPRRVFDVADLYRGPVADPGAAAAGPAVPGAIAAAFGTELFELRAFAVAHLCSAPEMPVLGGPGCGKTASAILMGVLAGYSLRDVRRGMQHGQPQMTVADLLGNPCRPISSTPRSSEVAGHAREDLDEYNRIPARTQSAWLTVMGDNYADILDQVYECPESAWFLTANDDQENRRPEEAVPREIVFTSGQVDTSDMAGAKT